MNFLHYDVNVGIGQSIRIDLDAQANVKLMDDANYSNYRNGRQYKFYGGSAIKTPVIMQAPYSGRWNLVIDMGGYAGKVNVSVTVI